MNFVFWLVILIVLALVWVTFTGAWTKLGDWLDMTFKNAKDTLKDDEKENNNER